MIGVFDSGIGGLTAVKALEKAIPDCDIIYFGDTARVPYGTRSREVIDRYALQDCRFLISRNVNAILVACGTVSSNSLPLLKNSFDVPIVGVVEAASRRAYETASAGNGVVAVLGTSATVKSGAYEKEILKYGGDVKIISRACPLLVPLVENGRVSPGDKLASIAVGEYLEDIIPQKPAAVILGCTHYPLLTELFSELLPHSCLINSAEEAANSLCVLIKQKRLDAGNGGNRTFYVTDDPQFFARNGRAYLGKDISDRVFKINIE
ncbi:MAG: glutamate racemase [Eubacteriales bacterium]|nr:glutamate racemase [Eubacteriales bacterium]